MVYQTRSVFEENEKHDSIADTPVEIQPKADTKMQDEEGILNNQDPAESENAGEGDGEDGEEMDEDAEESDDVCPLHFGLWTQLFIS